MIIISLQWNPDFSSSILYDVIRLPIFMQIRTFQNIINRTLFYLSNIIQQSLIILYGIPV